MTIEGERKILAQATIEKWAKVKDCATFIEFAQSQCAFCFDARDRATADGKDLSDSLTRAHCDYCIGAKDICDGINTDTIFGDLQRMAAAGNEEGFMAIIEKGLNDYAREWIK